MNEMQFTDSHLDQALEALLERRLARNRARRRLWSAISDRLGAQVSRRPWEWTIDTIRRSRFGLPFRARFLYTAATVIVVAVAVLIFLLFVDLGVGSESEVQPARPSEQLGPGGEDVADVVPAPSPTTVPPTPTAAPSLPAVVPAEVPEPGSETEKVLAVFTKWIEAIRAEDWQGVADLCPPENRAVATAEKIGFGFNQFRADYTRVTFPFAGYNVRNATVRLYGEDTARADGDIYNYNEFATGNISDLWIKKDGTWYSESYVCTHIQ